METIRGKTSQNLDLAGLNERIKNYQRVVLDLGTGDGRYVRSLADEHPVWFVIGVDSCRENLRELSRANLPNMLFVIASAQDLPHELCGLISHVTINFPWGSLLESLLVGDAALMNGLSCIARQNAQINICLNGGALAEAGTELDAGTQAIFDNMNQHGWRLQNPHLMDNQSLRTFPTTWARRLAHGRDPRAMALHGISML
jgi:16S rRNA (adenine(1408)-N(1))-methyltransferase